MFDRERERIIRTFSAVEREKFLAIGGLLPEHMPEPDEEWYVPDLEERCEAELKRRLELAKA